MTTATVSNSTGVLERIERLLPAIREQADAIEAGGRVPAELVIQLRDAGFYSLFVPAEWGGVQADPATALRTIEAVARADASTAWTGIIAAQVAASAVLTPLVGAREILGKGNIAAGVARPIGKAVWDEDRDGYVVSGRWPFASGSSHADWLGGEAVIYDGESPRKNEDGSDATVGVFVPAAQATIHQTWDTVGLRGTASNDIEIDEVFVPTTHTFTSMETPAHDWALYRTMPLVYATHGAVPLGIAGATLEAAKAIVNAKRGWGGVPLHEMPRIQTVVAEATALIEAARGFFYATVEELWAAAEEGSPTPLQRSRVRLATSNAAKASKEAVDLLHEVLATTVVFRSSPIERRFRDMHTAYAHVMTGPLTWEAAGRVELGKDADFPLF